jgi:hypothetical protein
MRVLRVMDPVADAERVPDDDAGPASDRPPDHRVDVTGGVGKTLEDLGLEVRYRLEADGERCLIVFDNVTDPDAIAPYVLSVGPPQVLITGTESSVTALGKPVHFRLSSGRFYGKRSGLAVINGPFDMRCWGF